jgi:hypothetical protein
MMTVVKPKKQRVIRYQGNPFQEPRDHEYRIIN